MSHLCDVPGLSVGHASDAAARTGVTTIVFDEQAVCGVSVTGGAPGTRETDVLKPGGLNPRIDAVCLSGGSAFGIGSGDGVQRALHAHGRGFALGPHRIPIVPGAVVFDLTAPPANFAALGAESVERALAGSDRGLGTIGAGTGATTAQLKGGIGAAYERVGDVVVGALAVVNAVGSVVAANGPWFRAHPFERDGEFGGLYPPPHADFATIETKLAAALGTNTIIGIVATDRTLSPAAANRLAASAHDGIALATWPAHTMFDGDTIFAVSTGQKPASEDPVDGLALAAAAVRAMARAVTRGVYEATPADGDRFPTYREQYPAAGG
ncbi:MAG: P1 family peptidase [Acuticoccus sp.]